jgi:sugar O-acyltransferase (sialic acid O-acetyltransferase NeuD family)
MSGLLIVGTGDHARVIDELARAAGHQVAGYVEPDPYRLAALDWDGDQPLLGGLGASEPWIEAHRGAAFVVAIGANEVRRRCYDECLELGLVPIALVHPSAVVLGGASVAVGAQVCATAMLGVSAHVEENAIVNSMASVDHDAIVERHAFVGPGAHLGGRVTVGTAAHVGIGAVVREGTIIGAGAFVAAGAVVIADVPAGTRVAGVPARPMDT